MATVAGAFSSKERRPDLLSGTPRANSIDRWIFVFMAAWFVAIVLIGFIPDSITKVAAVQAGQRPPLPAVMHVHAVAMGTFMLLLLAQTVQMATGRCEQHKKLGVLAFSLVPVLVLVGLVLARTNYMQFWDAAQSGPPALRPAMAQRLPQLDNILLLQIRVGILFPLFILLAFKARGANAGMHKRMIFLATAVPLPAAIDRMFWLPNTLPGSPVGTDLWILAVLSPLFIWDVSRNRRVHEAYMIWLSLYVPIALLTYWLWDTPWWHSTARRIMGV